MLNFFLTLAQDAADEGEPSALFNMRNGIIVAVIVVLLVAAKIYKSKNYS